MQAFSFLSVSPFVLAALFAITPAEVNAQVSCQSGQVKKTVPGVVIVGRTCDGRQIDGMGTTITAANSNMSRFMTLAPTRYCRAENSDPVGQVPGAYRLSFECSDPYGGGYATSGVGTTGTEAAQNAFDFAQLYTALNGVACRSNNYDIYGYVGGYKVNTTCLGVPPYQGQALVTGIGSTATAAGINALGFAELAASGRTCYLSGSWTGGAGYFEAFFQCGGSSGGFVMTGYGSTVTAAGQDALAQAQM